MQLLLTEYCEKCTWDVTKKRPTEEKAKGLRRPSVCEAILASGKYRWAWLRKRDNRSCDLLTPNGFPSWPITFCGHK